MKPIIFFDPWLQPSPKIDSRNNIDSKKETEYLAIPLSSKDAKPYLINNCIIDVKNTEIVE